MSADAGGIGLVLEPERPNRVGGEEEHARDFQLRANGDRQIAQLKCAHVGAWSKAIDGLPPGDRLDRQRRNSRLEGIPFLEREGRLTRLVLPKLKRPHRQH